MNRNECGNMCRHQYRKGQCANDVHPPDSPFPTSGNGPEVAVSTFADSPHLGTANDRESLQAGLKWGAMWFNG